MCYTLEYVLKFRCNGKVKTVKTVLYDGADYSTLLRIQDSNVNTAINSVSSKRIDGNVIVTILENNVD